MFFPEYIEKFGIEHFESSITTMERVTQFTSCEFAVRTFLLHYQQLMIEQMEHWSLHPNHHVELNRLLSSPVVFYDNFEI